MTTLAEDLGNIRGKEKVDAARIVQAARESGRSPFSMTLDYLKLRRRRGKLKFYEYFLYGLHMPDIWRDGEREEFVSAHIHWPLVNACNDRTWWAVTEDKWLSSCLLEKNNIAVPRTLAVFDKGARSYGETKHLKNENDLKSFLTSTESYPLFAKTINGMWSAGAFTISGRTDSHVLLGDRDPLSFGELVETAIGDQPYLIQECLKPHSVFEGITDAIATVRSLNIISDDGLKVPYTHLKLPQGRNIADNFWRPGNLLCDIEPETGKVRTIVEVKDGRRCTLQSLPNNQRVLVGEQLPFWQKLKELNRKVALLHSANRFGSTDIALTPDGPVVVEVNNGCAFELMQLATGKGFLTPEMIDFFQRNGAKI